MGLPGTQVAPRDVRDSMAAMNKRKSSRIAGVFLILFGVMPLLNSLSNPRLAAAHGSDLLKLIAVGVSRNRSLSIGWLVPLSGRVIDRWG